MPTCQNQLSEISSAVERYVETRMKKSKIHPDQLDVVRNDYRNWMFVYIKKQLGLKRIKQIQKNQIPFALHLIEKEKSRFIST